VVAGATAAPADREALRPAAARRDGALLPSSRAACSMDVVGAEALAEAATMRPAREASPHCLPRSWSCVTTAVDGLRGFHPSGRFAHL
jgi:hypothetical protein